MEFLEMAVICIDGELCDVERGRLLSVGWANPTTVAYFNILGLLVGHDIPIDSFFAPALEKMIARVTRVRGDLSIHQRAWGWGPSFSSLNSYIRQVMKLGPKYRVSVMENLRNWLGTWG